MIFKLHMSKKILVIAAHPDDEVLGCGGTIAKHTQQKDQVRVLFIADGENSRDTTHLEQRKKSAQNALKILGATAEGFLDFSDNQLDSVPLLQIIQKIERTIQTYKPEIVYTHHYGDLNIDHSLTNRAVMTACRPLPGCSVKEIYAFEVLSSTEWADEAEQFKPNHFVDIQNFWDKKVDAITEYKAEMREFPHSRSMENLDALSTFRGGSIGVQRAEAFRLLRSIR
jgi:LmbE family N-acetylglucosaminyl deacetylase